MDWAALAKRIELKRGCGQVIAAGREWSKPPTPEELQRWLEDAGFNPHPGSASASQPVAFDLPSIVIDQGKARLILERLVHFDLAYEVETGYRSPCGEIDDFLGAMAADSQLRTNGEYLAPSALAASPAATAPKSLMLRSWTPMTTATFDSGILTLHPKQTTFLWFLDED